MAWAILVLVRGCLAVPLRRGSIVPRFFYALKSGFKICGEVPENPKKSKGRFPKSLRVGENLIR
jgi:hypothetical protein